MLEGSLSPRTPLSQDAPDRAAYKHQSCRSQFWGLEIRGQGAGVARRGPSPRSDFLLCAHTAEGAGELSGGVSVIRTLIPVTKAPPTRPHQLPKAPLPNAITLGIRILMREFGPQTFGPQRIEGLHARRGSAIRRSRIERQRRWGQSSLCVWNS